jgi:molecular chaperone DnaK (HSP70)
MASIAPRAVGVDFGTSTSLVAEREGAARAEILPLGFQLRTRFLPSVAALRGGRIVLGEEANGRRDDGVIRSIKRGITENRDTVQVATSTGMREVNVDEVVLGLLTEIANRTRAQGLPLDEEPLVRLGCPAMWTGPQRRRLLELARRAGMPVGHASLVDEPVAAGVAWLAHRYLAHRDAPQGRVLVFDMGGGTLDVAVLDVEGGEKPDISVLAAIGLPEAGDDLDRALVRDFEDQLRTRGFDVASSPKAAEIRSAECRRSSTPATSSRPRSRLRWNEPCRWYGRRCARRASPRSSPRWGPRSWRPAPTICAPWVRTSSAGTCGTSSWPAA